MNFGTGSPQADRSSNAAGWLTDRYGVSWQIVPTRLGELMGGDDSEKSRKVMQALLQMRKIDLAELQRAYDEA